jgi:drug/metabolite transporter (DMT)-like permease
MKSMTILLVLLTNVCYAASSIFSKLAVDKIGKVEVSSIQIALSVAARFLTSPQFLGAIVAAIVGSVLYFFMLARMSLSIAYPLMSIAYLFVAFGSAVFCKETIPVYTWIGILFVGMGVALVSLKPA